ncbi:acyltransferase family protein [Pseudonocardia humida]|uniref:Acyltransferase family protein n=1 Tax=Pseudonocardia humida TaxID=2800819 RepID=A0ABT1A4Y2_9PSEU|nr:acyltransferase [Pseudonocardia humida]MCO1657899.1 acyltransferase family protein [Pseudonocardia humida]
MRAAGQDTGTTTAGNARGELRGLTGLRIVAAAWVVLFHFHFTPLPGVAEVVAVLGPLVTAGALGVDLFFVLSGFVIAYTYLDKLGPWLRAGATLRFVWARASRMWPLYALVFHVFGIWLVARLAFGGDSEIAFQSVQPQVDVGEWVEQLLMAQMWTSQYLDGASWVGSTWSISAEWLAYLLFPVAALGFFRMRNLPVAVLAAATLLMMAPLGGAYLLLGTPYYPWSWLTRILCGFGAGVLTYLTVRRLRSTEPTRRAASALAVAVPVVLAGGLLLGDRIAPGRGGVVIVLFPLLVAAVAVADRGPAMVLSTRWAVHGGHLSYALYLVHIPMLELYWLALRRFGWLAPDTALAHVVGVAVVLATVPVAALAFRLVEEPARRRMRAMLPAAPPAGGGRLGTQPTLAPIDVPATERPSVDQVGRHASGREVAERDLLVSMAPRHAAGPGRRPTLVSALIAARNQRPAPGRIALDGYRSSRL